MQFSTMPSRALLNYGDNQMQVALRAVDSGMSVRSAAKNCQVTRSTLLDKMCGRTRHERKKGRPPLLSDEEEQSIVDWIKMENKTGLTPNKDDVLSAVKYLITADPSRKSACKKPGRRWFKAFLNRHTDISLQISERRSKPRKGVAESAIPRMRNEEAEIPDKFLNDRAEESILPTSFSFTRFREPKLEDENALDVEFNVDREFHEYDCEGGSTMSNEVTSLPSLTSLFSETQTTASKLDECGILMKNGLQFGICGRENSTTSEQIAVARSQSSRDTGYVKRRKTEKVDDVLSSALTLLSAMLAPKHTAFSTYVCGELDNMSKKQVILAKKYISSILYLGNNEELHEDLF